MDTVFIKWQAHTQDLATLFALLSKPEQHRAERFTQLTDRERYIIAHGLLYQECAKRLAVPPQSLHFAMSSKSSIWVMRRRLCVSGER